MSSAIVEGPEDAFRQLLCHPESRDFLLNLYCQACTGQVVPSLEECVTAADDDCDGAANESCPTWAVSFGQGTSDDYFVIAFQRNLAA